MKTRMMLAVSAAVLAMASAAFAQTWGGPAAVLRDETLANSVILWAPGVGAIEWTPADGIEGMPILLKDNIETRDMPTTAGSLALADNAPGRDAPLVTQLRAAGAVILGKANLSEWANIRSSNSISGWSAVGGLTVNPYDRARTACGSSSGSAAAVATGLAPAAIGTETDGSITCPASVNGVVGFKPTVGLVSRTHIVPISHSQDTAGPIAVDVATAATVLSAIAGSDPADVATAEADTHAIDFRAALDASSLRGARLGVLRYGVSNYSPDTQAAFEAALASLRAAGAELVEITTAPQMQGLGQAELLVLMYELKADLNAYLASTDAAQVPTRTLAEVIAFNEAEPRETVLFGQELFV
jgi:amidase